MKNPRQPKAKGDYSNPKLALQILVKQTDWLDGEMHWLSDRVVWIQDGITLAPDQKDLAKAQRRLYKMAEFPAASKKLFGDAAAWLRCRQQKLELAKRVVTIDITLLSARRGKKKLTVDEVEQLAALIVAEALCVNLPSISPAESLFRLGEQSLPVLSQLLHDKNAPDAARALAAVLVGAVKNAYQVDVRLPAGSNAWMRRAFAAGNKFGMMENVSTLIWLINSSNSEALLERVRKHLVEPGPFLIGVQDARYMLLSGTQSAEVARIFDRLRSIEDLEDLIPSSKDLASQGWSSEKQGRKQTNLFRRQGYLPRKTAPMHEIILKEFASIIRQYVLSTRKSEVVDLLAQYIRKTMALDEGCIELLAMLIRSLKRGLTMSPEIGWHYIRMLNENQPRFWPPQSLVMRHLYGSSNSTSIQRLENNWSHGFAAFGDLLDHSQDPDWVQSLLNIGLLSSISHCVFVPEKQEVEVALFLNSHSNLQECGTRAQLVSLVHGWGSVERARAALLPLVRAIGALPDSREKVFSILCGLIGKSDPAGGASSRVATLEAAVLLTPALGKVVETNSNLSYAAETLVGQVAQFIGTPTMDKSFLVWSIDYLVERWINVHRVEDVIEVPFRLAGADFKLFQRLLKFWCEVKEPVSRLLVKEGLDILERHPTLKLQVARAISEHLQLCLRLFCQLILLERFTIPRDGILDALRFGEPGEEEPWLSLVAFLPDRKDEIVSLYRAAKVLGLLRLPAVVQDPIDLPRKMATELEFLRSHWQGKETPQNISIRMDRLADSMANPDELNARVSEQLQRHIEIVSAQLTLQAANHILHQQIKQELGTARGIDADAVDSAEFLLEAATLSVTLTTNRRLLRKLLREILFGNRHWARKHPLNERFLKTLSQRGIDVDTWLGDSPHVIENEKIPGSPIRLHLEQDPLLIMQMGNYFGTCLSLDSFNAFSAVADACDLNKRVLYATDTHGTVIARKLIAINTDLELVGFRPYVSMQSSNLTQLVKEIVNNYCIEFASVCRLPLSDSGEVANLVASKWYDDGIRQWGAVPDAEPGPERSCASINADQS
jgi:hypothetical protein